jgi:hypothetical protein
MSNYFNAAYIFAFQPEHIFVQVCTETGWKYFSKEFIDYCAG